MINLFSTPVKILLMPNFQELNTKIGKAISLGFERNFYEKLPQDEMEELKNIFLNEAEKYLKEIINKKIDLDITKSWTKVCKQYEYDTPHEHSGNTVIAVYYIKTPDKCGDLLLHDPRGATNFIPQYEKNLSGQNLSGRTYYRIAPRCGQLILFPAYIIHSVEPNMSEDVRISIAMNIKYKNFNQF
jgi:uncharacterized protein (TIGR02466 family)